MTIDKILIANRGEIACRIIKTCRKLGIKTVAVYSDADTQALHVSLADEAVHIGAAPSTESYLQGGRIIEAAKRTGAQAIHPAFGFLSENADFAAQCTAAGIKFIGPSAESIRSIGDKIGAKQLLSAKAPEVPLIPGYNGNDQTVDTLLRQALNVGFPLLIKASAGGGGRGLKVVRTIQGEKEADLKKRLRQEIEASRGESLRSFGDDKVLLERYFDHVKHIEVQIIGDSHGNVYHLYERECSVQRRHQKVIEETPSPVMDPQLRSDMTKAAIAIGKLIKYEGAGTIEFILDVKTRKFYFLECNTRLQVEHPITEAITELDLVGLQIHVANGLSLEAYNLGSLKSKGHAVEVRLYAEDPNNSFFPCTGQILHWEQPSTIARYDTGVQSGSQISVYYDAMISKIITYGKTREEALRAMKYTLYKTVCLGLTTNKSFLLQAMDIPQFMDGSYTTKMIDEMLAEGQILGFDAHKLKQSSLLHVLKFEDNENLKLLAQAPHQTFDTALEQPSSFDITLEQEVALVGCVKQVYEQSRNQEKWRGIPGGFRLLHWRPARECFKLADIDNKHEHNDEIHVEYVNVADPYLKPTGIKLACRFAVVVNGGSEHARVDKVTSVGPWFCVDVVKSKKIGNVIKLSCSVAGQSKQYIVACKDHDSYIHSDSWQRQFMVTRRDPRRSMKDATGSDSASPYVTSMPCRVLKLLVEEGSQVKTGDQLLTMESMKMEIRLLARSDGKVNFLVKENDVVEAGSTLCKIE